MRFSQRRAEIVANLPDLIPSMSLFPDGAHFSRFAGTSDRFPFDLLRGIAMVDRQKQKLSSLKQNFDLKEHLPLSSQW
jgi:hypothetical protein